MKRALLCVFLATVIAVAFTGCTGDRSSSPGAAVSVIQRAAATTAPTTAQQAAAPPATASTTVPPATAAPPATVIPTTAAAPATTTTAPPTTTAPSVTAIVTAPPTTTVPPTTTTAAPTTTTTTTPAPATTAAPPSTAGTQQAAAPGGASDKVITFIGDSIAIDVAPDLQKYYPNITVDGLVSRQFTQASKVVSGYLDKGALADIVVIGLGTNGSFTQTAMRDLINLIGADREIYFVNTDVPRSWCADVNSTLAAVAAEFPNVRIVDWYSVSVGHSEYFSKDGVHPNSTGDAAYASMLEKAIG